MAMSVEKQSLMIYRDLSVNERINLRSHYQSSAFRKDYYGGAPMMSVWGIIGAIRVVLVLVRLKCDCLWQKN